MFVWFDNKVLLIVVLDGYYQLFLVIGVDKVYQVVQDYVMFMIQVGVWQDYCCQRGIGDMNCKVGW